MSYIPGDISNFKGLSTHDFHEKLIQKLLNTNDGYLTNKDFMAYEHKSSFFSSSYIYKDVIHNVLDLQRGSHQVMPTALFPLILSRTRIFNLRL